jgi:hypothetical protein
MGMSSTPRAVVSRGNLGWVGESHRDGSTGTARWGCPLSPLKREAGGARYGGNGVDLDGCIYAYGLYGTKNVHVSYQ